MDDLVRFLALVTFGIGATWLGSTLLGSLLSRKGAAGWVWRRSGVLGYLLLASGFGLALYGLSLGAGSEGTSFILLGTVLGIAGVWLVR